MAFLNVGNVRLSGVAACVPTCKEENRTLPVFASQEDASKFIATTGIERRRIADDRTTTADLCYHAAERLIENLWGGERSDIDCLIFVTQTPDYYLPATSCILQERLGLDEECYTLDISLGCSGWVYGMSVLTGLLTTGQIRKGLLLCGDTILKICSRQDKSSWPLFGDAGTATAFEYDPEAEPMHFHLATDGSGYEAIIIPDGGMRNPATVDSFRYETIEEGIVRNRLQLVLNGMDVFSFGISKAPQSINKLLERAGTDRTQVDYFLFHQANQFMNEMIRKKLKLTKEQVPYSLRDFGNTSSASIPLTMVTELAEPLREKSLKLAACGFGVGLSWASVLFNTDRIVCPDLIEL